MPPLAGRLLVAGPDITGSTFARSVVLLLAHDSAAGALGVILNQPGSTSVFEVLPGWAWLTGRPGVVFAGGPVSPEGAVCLGHAPRGGQPDWTLFDGTVGTVDLEADPDEASATVEAVRIFAGYAGWGAGQLEAEISAGGWHVVDADLGDVFTSDPEELWRAVLRRQTGQLRLLATYPQDPSLN